jgi:hypothetical protein
MFVVDPGTERASSSVAHGVAGSVDPGVSSACSRHAEGASPVSHSFSSLEALSGEDEALSSDHVEEPELEEDDHFFAGDEPPPRFVPPRSWMPNSPLGMSLATAAIRGRSSVLRLYGKWARQHRGQSKALRFARSSHRRGRAHHQRAPRRARRTRVRRSSASSDGPSEQSAQASHWSPA